MTELLRKTLVGVLTAAVLVGPFAAGGNAAPPGVPICSVPGQITPHPVNWYSVKVPAFPDGNQLITDHAVEPLVPERMYVTNGSVVMRTSDSGCHWSLAYSLADSGIQGMTTDNSRILEIEVSAPGVVYLPVQQSDPVATPHVLISTDSGRSWGPAEGAFLSATPGEIRDLDASLGNGSAAAVLIQMRGGEQGLVSVDAGPALFVTNSAGGTWEPRHVGEGDMVVSGGGIGVTSSSLGDLGSVVMNPVRPDEIWLYGEAGVFRSEATALTPTRLGAVSSLDISLDGSAVLAYGRDAQTGSVSFDGGGDFIRFDTGFTVDSVDLAFGIPAFAGLSGFGRVYYQMIVPGQRKPLIFDISPLDGRPISDIQVGIVKAGEPPTLFGRTADTIEVTYQPKGERVDTERVETVLQPPVQVKGPNHLFPASREVVLDPGERKTIPYVLALPAATTPLDVYFLMDISGSMDGTINGVRSAMQEIVERLASRKLDVAFGVGSFRAYNDPPAYARDRDIGPADQSLANALNGLRAGGGGDETQMAALLQSATGEGDAGIPKGLNMNFRPGSLRVAILATDEPISQGGNHPSPDTVIDGLLAHDVKMAGLAIQSAPLLGEADYDNPGPPADVLQRVATGSKAVAPYGGVDCDGDGTPEIQEGGPIVCLIDPNEADDAALMADAVVNVLAAVEDVQDLGVSVSGASGVEIGGATDLVESVVPSLFPGVDLKEPSQHEFDLTVRCPVRTRKTINPLDIAVLRRGGALASARLTVVCRPRIVKEKEEPAPVLPAIVPIAAVVPPPPRPPDPVPEPNPNPQPNPQQNPQAQAGFAAQEQQQPQVALAHQQLPQPDVAEQGAMDEYLMSARRESRVPPVGFVFGAGAITSLFAYAYVRKGFRTAGARDRRGRRR